MLYNINIKKIEVELYFLLKLCNGGVKVRIDDELKSLICNFFNIDYNEFKYDGIDRLLTFNYQFMRFSDSKISIGIIEKIEGLFEIKEVQKNDNDKWDSLLNKGAIQISIDGEDTEVVEYLPKCYPRILTLKGKQFDFTTGLVAMKLGER